MSIVEEAFSRLFPETEFNFTAAVAYSKKFKPYNATVRKIGNQLHFSLSSSWKSTSDEIVIGLIQHLLIKILRREKFFSAVAAAAKRNNRKLSPLNMQLYDDFIKGVSDVTVASGSSDERLESSFGRVNEKYFLGFVDKPQLRWGSDSFRKLAGYDYHTNTITVSGLFRDAPKHLLDYLMYHELLHKKLKFSSGNGSRSIHHGREFRKLERNFEGGSTVESELNAFIRGSMTFLRKRSIKKRAFSWRQLLLLE